MAGSDRGVLGRALDFLVGVSPDTQPALPAPARAAPPVSTGVGGVVGSTFLGLNSRNDAAILRRAEQSPRLYAVVDRVAKDIAATNWRAYRIRGRSRLGAAQRRDVILHDLAHYRGPVRHTMRTMTLRALEKAEELERLESHPALDVWQAGAGHYFTGRQVRQMMQEHLEIVGHVGAVVVRGEDGQGAPQELWPFPMHQLTSLGGGGYEVRLHSDLVLRDLRSEDIIHLRRPRFSDPYRGGMGLGHVLATEIDLDAHAAQMVNRQFGSPIPRLLLWLKGASDTSVKRFKQELYATAAQSQNPAIPHLSNATGIDTVKLDQALKEMDVRAVREFQSDIIRETPGIPPEVLGHLNESNRATIDAAQYMYHENVIDPRNALWEDFLNARLMPLFNDPDVILCYESTVPEDREFSLQVMQARPDAFSDADLRNLVSYEDLENDEKGTGVDPELGTDILAIIEAVASGRVPYESGLAVLQTVYGYSLDNAQAMLGPAQAAAESSEPAPAPVGEPPEFEDDEGERAEQRHVGQDEKKHHARNLTDLDIAAVAGEFDADTLGRRMVASWQDELTTWTEYVSGDLGLDIDTDLLQEAFEAHVAAFRAERVTGWSRTTQRRIAKALQDGVAEGLDSEELVGLLQTRVKSMLDSEARTIVATEVHNASSFATAEAMRAAGVVARRWITQRDSSVRDSHRSLEGVTVEGAARYELPNGKSASRPGAFGDPAEDVNCRCREIPVREESRSFDAIYKAHDDEVRTWERRAQAHIEAGFNEALQAALRVLKNRG